MAVTLYGYAKCSTCRDAMKSLQRKGVEAKLFDMFETAPPQERIREWMAASGLPLKKLFNTSGEVYKEMNLKDKLGDMSEDEQIALLASNGRLVKRPIVVDSRRKKKITVGFKEEEYERVWGPNT
ncbi:arsenate reductase family protein [Paenibacillus koleovorans]|uniref:arsenate reductase family protein n=1 Tax=Paenibacillus koleovorans TaxID=121608 RepID=UPI000FD8CCFE|nr:arsenate reductase family protein [Paenibacillus koleovorans]